MSKKERWLLALLVAVVFFWVVDSIKKDRKIAFLEQYATANFEQAHTALKRADELDQRVADLQSALLACQGEKAAAEAAAAPANERESE